MKEKLLIGNIQAPSIVKALPTDGVIVELHNWFGSGRHRGDDCNKHKQRYPPCLGVNEAPRGWRGCYRQPRGDTATLGCAIYEGGSTYFAGV